MFACLKVFHLLKHLKCLHVSLFSSALPLFACMCPFPALRDHSVKRRLSHLRLWFNFVQFTFWQFRTLILSYRVGNRYGNSAIEKKTRHVNDSLQDFNSGIPLCFKAGLEMIPSFIDMHHQIQFTLSRGMVWFQTLTKTLLTCRKQQGCPMSINLIVQLCLAPSSSGIDFPLGTLAYYKAAIFSSMYAFWLIFSISDDGEGADVEP